MFALSLRPSRNAHGCAGSLAALLLVTTSLVMLPGTLRAQDAGADGETAAPVQEQEGAFDDGSSNQTLDPIVVEGSEPRPAPVRPAPRATSAPAAAAPMETPSEIEAEVIDSEDINGIEGYPITTRDSYTVGVATNGGIDPQPLRDIPQSVSLVTQERIEDQNLTTLDEAMRNTTGMVVLNNDQGRSSIFSRGYEINQVYVDGLPAPSGSLWGTVPDLAPYDRIEVMKGPAGLLSGSNEAAGLINMVRKRPFDVPAASAYGLVGSWDYYRGEADVSTPIGASGKVRARAVGAIQSNDTWVDYNDYETEVGYGIIEADITDNTTLSFSYTRQDREITVFNGLPAYADGTLLNIDRSRFVGGLWNDFDNSTNDYQLGLHHDFAGGGYFEASARWYDADIDFDYAFSGSAVDPETGIVSMSQYAQQQDQEAFSADAHLSLPFQALGQEQNVLVGTDYRKYDYNYLLYRGSAGSLNVFDPSYSTVVHSTPDWQTNTAETLEQTGIYGQVRLKPIEPLMVILGGRVDWYKNTINDTTLATGLTDRTGIDLNGETTPYAGVIFDISDNLSAYASYTEIFRPNTVADSISGDPDLIEPMRGEQYEVGLKGSWLDDRLNASVAHFHNEMLNDAVSLGGPVYATADILVQGAEVEVSGSPMEGLDLYAGYTYTKTEYLKIATDLQGTTFSSYTPEHIVQLWAKYTFQKGTLEDFHVGAGGRYLSSFYTEGSARGTGDYRIEQDGFIVVDSSVGYTFENDLDLTFSVKNLFDEKYYARLGSPSLFNFYGAPRSYWLRASMDF